MASFVRHWYSVGVHRLLSLILIPLFVLGPALPHSHAGSESAPANHGLRPHVHLHGHDHHNHGDEHHHAHDDEPSENDSLSTSAEHDSDAVYFAVSDQFPSRSTALERIDLGQLQWIPAELDDPTSTATAFQVVDPPDSFPTLPVYLLNRTLRL